MDMMEGTPSPSRTLSHSPSAANHSSSAIRTISPERREWVKKESEDLLVKNLLLREKTKVEMYKRRLHQEKLQQQSRDYRVSRWMDKTRNSPFAVNLVAEDERITEENRIRMKEESERKKMIDSRKEKAKNEIILKALSEFSDLEALRKEKRAILEEEQRLRALLSLEKVTATGKADRIVAERAQKHRQTAKLEQRRKSYRDSLDHVLEEERLALMRKHGLLDASASSVSR